MAEQPIMVVVVGLGYVGLPLAIALSGKFACHGLDINTARIAELRDGWDRTGEISEDRLNASTLTLTADPAECPPADIYIVTVPTPVDEHNKPDLGIVFAASRTVATMLDPARKPIIVFESTVYPGVTEDLCRPLIEEVSGLVGGQDFFLGYSPERINPGDREHTIDRITKVVSGENPEVLKRVAAMYGAVTSGGVFKAQSIKVAEAAKVIENAQRDINIAFMNEIAQIFGKMDISVWDVLAAARTKWNFLPFSPGLVGGHCIGVDPYYLSHRAEELGYDPKIILSGRETNDAMADRVAASIDAVHGERPKRALVMGLTFKEDVPDLRNSKVADLIRGLEQRGHAVTVHDPHADAAEAHHEYGLTLSPDALDAQYDLVVLAVSHANYLKDGAAPVMAMIAPDGTFADLRNCFAAGDVRSDVTRWSL